MNSAIEVWVDANFLEIQHQAGTLFNDHGTIRFEYSPSWLKLPHAFNLDPDLSLDRSPFFPRPDSGNFGVFLDSSPDRWGQTLLQRRDALEAKREGRPRRNLYAWDYLIGVQDLTRQGAIRFKKPGTDVFLDSHPLAAPPVTSLSELESIAKKLSQKNIENLDELKRWLSVLVAPGASLGGARPKANFTEADGSLWIAKFPAKDDSRNVGAWEWLTHCMAKKAGIVVPEAKLFSFGQEHQTFAVKRFDRQDGRRIFYASAMTLLKKPESDGSSYLELAQFIQRNGCPRVDLEELFRRVVFNVAVGNRDDHLRNHGFLLGPNGWQLAPAFDVNPSVTNAHHVLCIDDSDNEPNLNTVLSTCDFYGLEVSRARSIIDEVVCATTNWRELAKQAKISRADIETTEGAFEALSAWEETEPAPNCSELQPRP